jgi:DNA-binding winged helix-turn-helix (wHTH) protein
MADLEDREIGDLTVSPSRRLVVGPAGSASLEPLVMQMLLLLANTEDRVLSRSKLFESLWNSPQIGNDSLNRLAFSLRRTLIEVESALRLETVPRSGYRLTGASAKPVERLPPQALITRRSWIAAAGVAVLAAGGSSWLVLKNNADEERGAQLAARGERMLSFGLPGQREGAVTLLSEAAALKPSDARLWGLLAYAKALVVSGGEGTPTSSRMMAAERAIAQARALQEDEPNAELAMLVLGRSFGDWGEADGTLRGILKRDPDNHHALGWLVALTQSSGHAQESWSLNERQMKLDPVSPEPIYRRALKLWIAGRVNEADRVIDPLLRLWPSHPWVWNARFLIYAFTGRPQAALMMMEDPGSRPPRLTTALIDQWRPTLAALGRPEQEELGAALNANLTAAAQSPGQAAYAVMALSALGEVDAAFEVATGLLLSKGNRVTRTGRAEPILISAPTWRQTQWLFTPATKALRMDKRFPDFAEQIGLAGYWRQRGGPDPFLLHP